MAGSLFCILVLGTLGETPSLDEEFFGVRGSELDRLSYWPTSVCMIAIGKADVCIQTESLNHEEISGRPYLMGASLGSSAGRYK
eukprot:6876602-Pyramimonas_sp.AAC.1